MTVVVAYYSVVSVVRIFVPVGQLFSLSTWFPMLKEQLNLDWPFAKKKKLIGQSMSYCKEKTILIF
jgi:hypothetical protein